MELPRAWSGAYRLAAGGDGLRRGDRRHYLYRHQLWPDLWG